MKRLLTVAAIVLATTTYASAKQKPACKPCDSFTGVAINPAKVACQVAFAEWHSDQYNRDLFAAMSAACANQKLTDIAK